MHFVFCFFVFASVSLGWIPVSSANTTVIEQIFALKGYKVIIQTEDEYAIAGTNSNVSIQLVGNKRESEWVDLRDDFTPGKVSVFSIRTRAVGSLLVLRIRVTHASNVKDEWGVKTIRVEIDNNILLFPLYEFIVDTTEVVRGKVELPQNIQNQILKEQRKIEIEKNKIKWAWKSDQANGPNRGFPRILDASTYEDLPFEVQMNDVRLTDFITDQRYSVENVDLELKQYATTPWNSLEAYKNIYSHPYMDGTLPQYIQDWQTDQEFGRQILNGINPTAVELCGSTIEGSNITSWHLNGLIEEETLDEAIAGGKVFMVNHFESLKDVPRNAGFSGSMLHAADPLCLLYAHSNGTFVPVAIQLKANDASTIFTPKDSIYDWMLAKMHFRCTHGNHNEWITHFLATHLSIEPIAIATFRMLPRNHPIYKLLRHHLQHVVAINHLGRQYLLPSLSYVQNFSAISGTESVRRGYMSFSFDHLNIPKFLQKRGTMNYERLTNYHYRDDVVKVWKIVKDYVADIVENFYTSDENVKEDFELQNWIYETATEGFGWEDGNYRDVPTKFDTVEELSSFCTLVIATSSIQHAAVSFGQWDIHKFIPNAPLGLRQPIHRHGEGSLQKVMDTLPSVVGSTVQGGVANQLSHQSRAEVYLGEFPMDLFHESRVATIRKKLRKKLDRYQDITSRRNKHLQYPYEYLRPDRMASGTSL